MAIYGNAESIRLGPAQTVTSVAGPTSTSSTTFGPNTYQVLVTASAPVNFRIGNSPLTAVAADTLLPANFPFRLYVSPGQILASVGAGTVSITELV
jgi:hypothetical protein